MSTVTQKYLPATGLMGKIKSHLTGKRIARTLSEGTAADQAIALQLFELFERDLAATDLKGLHFYVYDGTVSLYGAVDNPADHESILTLVRESHGVKGVNDNIRLVQSEDVS